MFLFSIEFVDKDTIAKVNKNKEQSNYVPYFRYKLFFIIKSRATNKMLSFSITIHTKCYLKYSSHKATHREAPIGSIS